MRSFRRGDLCDRVAEVRGGAARQFPQTANKMEEVGEMGEKGGSDFSIAWRKGTIVGT